MTTEVVQPEGPPREEEHPKAGRRYSAVAARATVVLVLLAAYLCQDFLMPKPPNSHGGVRNRTTIGGGGRNCSGGNCEPRWLFDPLRAPYMGNFSCIFEAGRWELESNVPPHELEKRKECARLRYRPHGGWVPPDPNVVFEKLPNGTTVYMAGDSIMNQQAVDFLCLMASASRMTRLHGGPECRHGQCDPRGLNLVGASFRSAVHDDAREIRVMKVDGNFGAYREAHSREAFKKLLSGVKGGDVFVFNAGLHYRDRERLLRDIGLVLADLKEAMGRGARLVWRETVAGHFDPDAAADAIPDGYWRPGMTVLQANNSADCVPHARLNATASFERYNGEVTRLMRRHGVHVLETWEASFLLPEWCHLGNGVDCVHYLQRGGTSYLTEALLKYIEEDY